MAVCDLGLAGVIGFYGRPELVDDVVEEPGTGVIVRYDLPEPATTLAERLAEGGPLDVAVDGRPAGELPPGGTIDARFVREIGTIAQLPHSSFYRRLREKFGRLAS